MVSTHFKTITIIGKGGDYPRTEGGRMLQHFFSLYPSQIQSQWIDVDLLDAVQPFSTDILIVFTPHHPTFPQLKKINYTCLLIAQYSDDERPNIDSVNEFGDHATAFLQPAVNRNLSSPVRLEPMPLTLNKKPLFPHFLANLDLKYRYFNASFVGAATRFQGTYPQRKEWVKELVDCGRSRLQVGIIDHEHYPINELFDNPAPYRHRFLGPGFYLALMVQSKICLTPSGNARWSYRHYEAVQCGNIRVSTDLSGLELLIPIPSQATIFVPDHTDVLPFILSALDQIDRYQPLVRQGQTQLNQSLTRGEYDPNNPSVLYSFLKKWN